MTFAGNPLRICLGFLERRVAPKNLGSVAVDAWAQSKIGPLVRSTSELHRVI